MSHPFSMLNFLFTSNYVDEEFITETCKQKYAYSMTRDVIKTWIKI